MENKNHYEKKEERIETEGNCYEESDFNKKKDIFDINPYE